MSVEYNDLHALIFQNVDARQFYNELPKPVRDKLNLQASQLYTYERLIEYAEKLMV